MKITIERNALLNVLKHTTGIVEKRNTIPVLANVLISAIGAKASFTASDMEIEIHETVEANVEQAGTVTAPAQMLFDIVRKLPSEADVSLVLDGSQLIVSSGRSKFKLGCLPVDDFPVMGDNKHDASFKISVIDFADMLDRVRFAMSSEETRYYLNGVLLHASGDALKAVATDGHRLAISETAKPEGYEYERGVIIPRKTVNEVRKVMEEAIGEIEVRISASKISFLFGPIAITSKLIDGTYPDYERVIPTGNDKLLTVNADALIGAVDRVSTISNEKTRAIKLELMPCELSLSSSASEGNAKDTIDATFDGEPMDIGFNAKYVLDVLQKVGGSNVKIEFGGPESPAVIKDAHSLYVLMPMRV